MATQNRGSETAVSEAVKASKADATPSRPATGQEPILSKKPTVLPDKGGQQTQTEQPTWLALRDLSAQEVMAEAAVWMVIAALLTFVVTSLGTTLIWRQVKLTRKAVADTGRATIAMERQNKLAEDTAQRQLRAYISIEDVEVHDFRIGGSPRFVAIIKNRGQTPAYRVRSVVIVRSSAAGPDSFRIRFGNVDRVSSSELGPGQGIPHWSTKKGAVLEAGDLAEVLTGIKTVIFAGVVTYNDAFGRRRRTIFRHYMDPSKELDLDNGFAGLILCEKGNRSN